MALIVEDGTGLSNSESFVSVAAFRVYCESRGVEFSSDDTTKDEQALRRATDYISGRGAGRWYGWLLSGGQALSWPRRGVSAGGGYYLDPAPLPSALVAATIEAAIRERRSPGSLLVDYDPTKRITSATVGPVSVDYKDSGSTALVIPAIDNLLAGLVSGGSGRVKTAFLKRA